MNQTEHKNRLSQQTIAAIIAITAKAYLPNANPQGSHRLDGSETGLNGMICHDIGTQEKTTLLETQDMAVQVTGKDWPCNTGSVRKRASPT